MKVTDPQRLARQRRRLGYTQADLANLVGCTQQYISMIERGADRDCSEGMALRIANRLDLDLEDVFDARPSLHATTVPRSKRGTKRRMAA
ncbi:helix-turn-helix transcriptional regulator [Tessaracoccus palaemonis]|uniref:Helix-turn-helix transcriptional regulator n=1 Tax=Tessaracoccus palaemonis TaxID=2829499 RepID=A0ABX8SH67_9ACTN|nr:helix-turn-helix transcriptional regulator [Tessaracoccus palaemonis]QXT62721.1 helix-turn-helix transcriptional regulator [Tessaracoccus palaemonis]